MRLTIKKMQERVDELLRNNETLSDRIRHAENDRDRVSRQLSSARTAIGTLKQALRMSGEAIKLTAESVPE